MKIIRNLSAILLMSLLLVACPGGGGDGDGSGDGSGDGGGPTVTKWDESNWDAVDSRYEAPTSSGVWGSTTYQ